jgi:hypothetical protein
MRNTATKPERAHWLVVTRIAILFWALILMSWVVKVGLK